MARGSYAFIVFAVATHSAYLVMRLQQVLPRSFSWAGIAGIDEPLLAVLALAVMAWWISQMGARLRDAGVQKPVAIFAVVGCLGCWAGSVWLDAKWQNRWIPYFAVLVTQAPIMIAKSKVSQTP